MNESKKITFHNADEGEVAKCILAGCYKFGAATLLRQNGSTMTSVIETNIADQKESKTDLSVIQYPHGFNYGSEYTDGICPSITISSWQHNNFIKYMADKNTIELPSELKGKKFRIRKLTPRECFRLMGVDDKDIDKIQAAGISNSGQYKLAGNSIVVGVLFHLFRKMFIDKGMEATKEGQQLSLF